MYRYLGPPNRIAPRQEPEKPKEIYVSLVGNGGVGKTTIMSSLTFQDIPKSHLRTIGLEAMFCPIFMIANEPNKSLLLFDHAGQKKFRGTDTGRFWAKTDIFIYVFDMRYPETLECIKSWSKYIREVNETAPVYFVGTKVDRLSEEQTRAYDAFAAPHVFINAQDPREVWAMIGTILIEEGYLSDCSYANDEMLQQKLSELKITRVAGGDEDVDLDC